MDTTIRPSGVLAGLAALLLLASAAPAVTIDSLMPECGAPGDAIVVRGEGFGKTPTVRFAGIDAEVLCSHDRRILCVVPEGTGLGAVTVTVDGTSAPWDFTVLPEGTPVVIRVSTETAAPGTRIFVFGRRLGGGEVAFLDARGDEVAAVEPLGRHRAILFAVPGDLDPGTYTLRITNGDDLDTGDFSPTLEVVAAGPATLTSIDPAGAVPGDPITLSGSDLRPAGTVRVVWEDEQGAEHHTIGFSNGHDEVRSRVPFWAEAGGKYEVSVELRRPAGWVSTGSLPYTVGTPEGPSIDDLDPAAAPAGAVVRIRGGGLFRMGTKPVVTMTLGTTELEAKVLWTVPGFGPGDEVVTFVIPEAAEDGDWSVTVTVGDDTSGAAALEVGVQPLTVDSLAPASQGRRGGWRPVLIEGSGFGALSAGDLEVTWDDGGEGDPLAGKILYQTDDMLLVLPPGDIRDPLPSGTYTVRVTRDPDGSPETVVAGTYTVR